MKHEILIAFSIFAVILIAGCSEEDEFEKYSEISSLHSMGGNDEGGYLFYPNMKIKKMLDGKTIELEDGNIFILAGVDCPEKDKPGYEEASQILSELLSRDKNPTFYSEKKLKNDSGKFTYYVIVAVKTKKEETDETVVNEEMIRSGYAKMSDAIPYRLLKKYLKLEMEAREAKRGLWATAWKEEPEKRENAEQAGQQKNDAGRKEKLVVKFKYSYGDKVFPLVDDEEVLLRDVNPEADSRIAGITVISKVRQVSGGEYEDLKKDRGFEDKYEWEGHLYFVVKWNKSVWFEEGVHGQFEAIDRYRVPLREINEDK